MISNTDVVTTKRPNRQRRPFRKRARPSTRAIPTTSVLCPTRPTNRATSTVSSIRSFRAGPTSCLTLSYRRRRRTGTAKSSSTTTSTIRSTMRSLLLRSPSLHPKSTQHVLRFRLRLRVSSVTSMSLTPSSAPIPSQAYADSTLELIALLFQLIALLFQLIALLFQLIAILFQLN